MSREVSLLPHIVEVRFRYRAKPCETCGDTVAMREVSLRVPRFSPAIIVLRMIHSYQNEKRKQSSFLILASTG
jgi:hypothetical protein